MHFGRSHSRSKSRSPAPPASVGTPSGSRPPTFFPPSHYAAAAAGISYGADVTPSGYQYSMGIDNSSMSYPALDESFSSGRTPAHTGAVGRLIGKSSNKDLRDKRQSQLGGIPLLETHLLPSLRDTIDRMTQSPRPSLQQSESIGSERVVAHHTPSSQILRSTPEPSSVTNIPRFRSEASPIPKSALKSPARRETMSKFSSSNTPVRSMTSSKYSPRTGNVAGEREERLDTMTRQGQPTERYKGSAKPSSLTSHTAPRAQTAIPKRKPDTRSKSNPTTPQNIPRLSVFATPQPERPTGSPLQYSSLPRPKSSRKDHLFLNDSGSELERRVGRAHSPGKLVVANAVIIPSSSESDHDAKSRNRRSQWLNQDSVPSSALPHAHNRHPSKAQVHRDACIMPSARSRSKPPMAIGLGLKVDEAFGAHSGRFPIDDDSSVYDVQSDTHSLIMDEPVLVPATEDDDASIYDDEPLRADGFNRRSPVSRSHSRPESWRRREALLGIVDSLHRDYGDAHDFDFEQSISESGSGRGNIRGLAIGGSTELQHGSATNSVSFPRTSFLAEQGLVSSESEASHSDDESTYSNHDDYDMREEPPDNYVNARREEQKSLEPMRSSISLRQNRTSWKRNPNSLGVHEAIHAGHRSPSPSKQLGDRRRSISPAPLSPRPSQRVVSPAPPSPRPSQRPVSPVPPSRPSQRTTDQSIASSRSPHGRSKSTHERAPTSRRDTNSSSGSKRSSSQQRQTADSGGRSSRLLSSSPRLPSGNGLRPQDDTRERLGFGIPESLSYSGNITPDEPIVDKRPPLSRLGSAASTAPGISRADSDLSVADAEWQDQVRVSKDLSRGAAALFDALATTTSRSKNASYRPSNGNGEQDKTPLAYASAWDSRLTSRQPPAAAIGDSDHYAMQSSSAAASVSTASSPPSEYEEPASPPSEPESEYEQLSPPQVLVHEASSSWRSSLSTDVYGSLSRHYGPTEMERQELIYSLSASEDAFVKAARRVIRTTVLPLRARESRAWLPELPTEIARFFDWLEDIVNLHVLISRALSAVGAIWQAGSIVQRVAGTLKGFVPRLEVYMPYLAKYEGVREAVRWHMERDGGEFGEYLRMKERDRAEGEWSLEKLLEEPGVKLRGYLGLFQRLQELTAREHPDHLATLSLLYSVRTAVRVMEEVKAREEEYDFIKDLSVRIDGLPGSPSLARRSRRLLWFGLLVQTDSALQINESSSSRFPSDTTAYSQRNPQVSHQRNRGREQGERTQSKLASAIRDWTTRRSRAGSLSSTVSSLLSVQTYDSASTASSTPMIATPRSDQFPGSRIPGRAGSKGSARSPQVSRAAPAIPKAQQLQDVPLNVMVFSDLVVLALPSSAGRSGGAQEGEQEQRSRLVDGIGLARILGVSQVGDRAVRLSLIPIPPDQLDTGITVENTAPTDITLSVLPSEDPAPSLDELVKALRKCHHHTVRGLSYPSLPTVVTDDLELDTRHTLVGILSTGLPLPKSPSMQFNEASQAGIQQRGERGAEEDKTLGEREERGWWTLRFQQVLRELQREEVPVSLAGQWATT